MDFIFHKFSTLLQQGVSEQTTPPLARFSGLFRAYVEFMHFLFFTSTNAK